MPVPVRQIVHPKGRIREAAALPPLLVYHGGALLTTAEVTTIFWGSAWISDPLRVQLDAFFDFIVGSSLVDQLSEYSVPGQTIGHGSHLASFAVMADPGAVVDDSAVQNLINQLVSSGTLPAPNPNSLYFVFTPNGTTVILQGQQSCQQFCGYHSPGANYAYAVVPYPSCTGCGFASTIFDSMTVVASHELCEAITDPNLDAWYDDNTGEEIGDICEGSNNVISAASTQTSATAGTSYSISGTGTTDATGNINASLTLTPIAGGPPPPPPPPTSYVVQKEWSNAQGSCV